MENVLSAGKAVTVRGTQLVKRHFKERRAESEKERGTRRGLPKEKEKEDLSQASSCSSFPRLLLPRTWMVSFTQL